MVSFRALAEKPVGFSSSFKLCRGVCCIVLLCIAGTAGGPCPPQPAAADGDSLASQLLPPNSINWCHCTADAAVRLERLERLLLTCVVLLAAGDDHTDHCWSLLSIAHGQQYMH